jgi:cobalt/nickel transport system permease protein
MNTDPPRPIDADVSSAASGAGGIDPRAAMLLLACTCAAIVASPADARLLLFATGILFLALKRSLALLLLRRILLLLPMSAGVGMYMYFAASGSMDPGPEIRGLSPDALALSSVAVARMLLIASASLLFGLSVPMQQLAAALRALRVPDPVVSVLWMSERLFYLLVSDARRMLETVRARSVGLSVRLRIRTVSRMSSAFLVRAVSRSDRMADALLARGFDGRVPTIHALRWCVRDTLACCVAAALLSLTVMPL